MEKKKSLKCPERYKSASPYCEKCDRKTGYFCTRKKGHKGEHHAHGSNAECYAIWK